MIKVGLTGGIGSGKTFIASIFERLGIPVFNSDTVASKLLHDEQIKTKIIESIGAEAYHENGQPNKQYIRDTIFANEKLRTKINGIIHPAVQLKFELWCNQQTSNWIIKEAAILFESGADKGLDSVILVTCPEEIKIKRIQKRDGLDKSTIQKIIVTQMADKEKEARSEFIIVNDEKKALLPQILYVFTELNGRSEYEVNY